MAIRLPAEQRKAAVLDCACGIFSTGSYRGTTTAQIARLAGVTEPVLYRHFASKRDLYLAVLEESWRRFCAGIALKEVPDIRAILAAHDAKPPQPQRRHWIVRPFVAFYAWFGDYH